MNQKVRIPIERLSAFCLRWKIRELAVFGSALRDDFGADSDIDFLVSYEPGATPGWPQILDLREELAELVGRRIDIVERRQLERSPNYIKRHEILHSAEPIYAQG